MTWRPPAMTYEGGPRICGYCAADQHEKCDGTAWCEATQTGADCPCGVTDRAHGIETVELPPGVAEALERHRELSFLPDGCECIIQFTAGATRAERIPSQRCEIPDTDHQDHRRQDTA